MIMRDRSNLLKNLLVMGAAGASLLVSFPALSQTSSESTAPEEITLSAEGMKILCEVFPLNSRCQGGEQPTAVPSVSDPRSATPSTSLEETQTPPSLSPEPSAPGETTSPSLEPSAPEPSDSMSPGDEPASDSMESPSLTPGSALPSYPSEPKPQSSTAPGAEFPTETNTPRAVPSAAPKGEADRLRTEVPASAQAPTTPSTTPATPGETPTPSAAPAPSETPANPSATPPSTTPASPQAPSAAPTTGTPVAAVSEAELQKFAKVIPQLQEIQQSAQQQVSEAIEKAGISEDRFRELYGAQQSPPVAQPSTPATPQEQQAVQKVVAELETIQTETQTLREQAVQSQGLEITRFNEILTAVRQDSGLQQQLQQILSN